MKQRTLVYNIQNNLDEISLIRLILSVVLILYHAFAPWCGAWKAFEGFAPDKTYWWIGKFAYSFMLPMFVFISGYVWAYQREVLQKRDSLRILVIKKFKRLYIPSLIFSIVYFIMIDSAKVLCNNAMMMLKTLIAIMGGYAHMWFLPMLFWLFVVTYFILKNEKKWKRWFIVILLCILSVVPIPFGIGNSFYYIIYFYAGYELLLYRECLFQSIARYKIGLIWILFIFLFVVITSSREDFICWYTNSSFVKLTFGRIISNFLTKAYSSCGILALMLSVIKYTKQKNLNSTIIWLSSYCFGVYLFQQFILQIFYRFTSFPLIIGNNLLPWVGFVLAFFLSFLLSWFFKQIPLSRSII